MVKSCTRDNSLDSSLADIEVNDIASLLQEYDSIKSIAFTGRKAQMLYKMHFDYLDIPTHYLPSPSSAYAKMSLEQKIKAYEEVLRSI
jgi:TDG/mug DNA glycosylase family protein